MFIGGVIMPAIINHKICDQASACGGIAVCPVGAFIYNEKTKKIEIDNDKCISCGLCESACPIGAIGVAKTWEEYEELKKEIENDPRTPEDLFVDRYGGDIINEDIVIEKNEIIEFSKKGQNVLIELFNDDSIMCLLKSIPYQEIVANTYYKKYYKCFADELILKQFKIKELPTLLCFQNGKLIKTIQGYFDDSQKQDLLDLLNK